MTATQLSDSSLPSLANLPVEEAYPWLAHEWRRLCQMQDTGLLPATLLLSGGQGIGKADLLMRLAARLLCSSPTQQGACGHCKSCKLLAAGNHPDIMPCVDGATKVDHIRALIDFTLNTPQQGKVKVVLLGPLEDLNTFAGNALLKCMEEPTPDTHLLLFSHAPLRVMPTLRSRCLSVNAPKPDYGEALRWLSNHSDTVSQSQLKYGLSLSDGTPLQALEWLAPERQKQCDALLSSLVEVIEHKRLPSSGFKSFSVSDLPWVLDWLLRLLQGSLRDLALMHSGVEPQLTHEDPRYSLFVIFKTYSFRRLFLVLEGTQSAKRQVLLGANPNVALFLEQWALEHLLCSDF